MIDRLRSLAAAASPEPWWLSERMVCSGADAHYVAEVSGALSNPDVAADAAYIAALSPDVLTALLDMAEAATPPIGTRLVIVAEDILDALGIRTERGDRITAEWGEPDEHGWYTPTFTKHTNDNLVNIERARIFAAVEAARQSTSRDERYDLGWDDALLAVLAIVKGEQE